MSDLPVFTCEPDYKCKVGEGDGNTYVVNVATLEKKIAALVAKCDRLAAENERLRDFVDFCYSLTGDLWPQNETTEILANEMDARGLIEAWEGSGDASGEG